MKTSLLTLTLLSSFALSGEEYDHSYECLCYEDCCCTGVPFITIGGGYAWSFRTDIKTGPFWDPSPQGYDDDLNQSEFYLIGFGYHFPCWISASFQLDYHPSFRYKRFQHSTAVETLDFLGDKTRHFRVSNTAFTFNLFLNRNADFWCWNFCGCSTIAPFIGAAVGVAYNTVSDFHSVLPLVTGEQAKAVRSIMLPNRQVGFAAQAMGGIALKYCENFSLDIAYRWFYGGKFRSNNFTIDSNNVDSTPYTTQPWKGTLMANEILVSLTYSL